MQVETPVRDPLRESIARLVDTVRTGRPQCTLLGAICDLTHEGGHVPLDVPMRSFLAGMAEAGVPARDALRRWVRANGRFTDVDGRRFRIQNRVPGALTDRAIAALAQVAPHADGPCVVAHERDGWRVAPKRDPFSRW